jgi:gamma-glutamyltranspeptidase/glutathione hydrolase
MGTASMSTERTGVKTSRVPAGVAAGHPATVEAGMRVLAEGGNAVDAAIAATFASCAAETILCGLGGGGFATVFSANSGSVAVVDFFCAMPGLSGETPGPMVPVEINFGGVPIPYSIGGASVAVPGVPAGCAELHRRFGRLPWLEIVQPAYDIAHHGVPIPHQQAQALRSISAAMTLDQGATAYAPGGRLLDGGDHLRHPGLDDAFALLAMGYDEFAAYTTPLLVEAVRAGGGALSSKDVEAYQAVSRPVRSAGLAGRHVCGRLDLNRTLPTIAALPSLEQLPRPARAVATARALRDNAHRPEGLGETTNISAVDSAGNACVITHTLGLGSGIWLPDLGIHLNSMLGEGELLAGHIPPGDRVHSMMCPLVVLSPTGHLEMAVGSAGASRIRSALLSTLVAYLVEGKPVFDSVASPRLHVAGQIAHLEPDYPADAAAALAEDGFIVQRWEQTNHYFGGVSAVGHSGAAGDPRRGGHGYVLDEP